ncbi:hypothetical protein BDA99DRAFT_506761 [Phascolomyces articulosus]|uniref:Uncharacterized protein n=1 Tax=Phascolomyces articulosus TaxID=60185 RepID=A0AAD5K3B9_9FUNG|nr:hypothetical protein BDA99DRAFT_506761 [Phascolomyces articulosus]
MLLRPAKIFTPLHQLRHFLESKVSELVQQQTTVSSALQNAKTRFYHVSSTQQVVYAKAHYHSKAPTLFHVAEQEQQRLLKALQQQFPIVKVFSSPTIARPPHAYQFSFASATSQQYRTIMSSTTASSSGNVLAGGQADGFYAAANGFYNSGCGFFPRTVVGYARTPFAARQFSTVKSPCVTLFQQTTNNTATNTGFSHISSRFFSPAGSKMSSPFPNGNESHARPSALSTSSNDDENKDPSQSKADMFSRQRQCKGMSDLIQEEEGQVYPNKRHQAGLVRRGSVAGGMGYGENNRRRNHQRTRNSSGKTTVRFEYIRQDDLSCKYTPKHSKSDTTLTSSSGRHHHHWHSSRVKAPPDKKEEKEKGPPKPLTVVYLSFQLDGAPLWHSSDLSSSQVLDFSLIQSVDSIARLYQMYLTQVVRLLNELQRHGKFRAVLNGNELCVMFPSSEHWPEDDRIPFAQQWLNQVGIDPESPNIVLKEMLLPEIHQQHPLQGFNKDFEDEEILGPEYFKGIQSFLDHVDDLIETGPAFGRH